MILGGPALYLVGESMFRWRMTGATQAPRVAVAAALILLAPLGGHLETLTLSIIVTALLTVLAAWELRSGALRTRSKRLGFRSRAHVA
jgi:low temperature requirement protein LtrA